MSEPPLVDQSKEFVYRQCVDGVWAAEPTSCVPQKKNLPECPEGFTEYFTYCYVFTEQSKYPPSCPFPNYQPFSIYQFIIVKPEMPPVWMPVHRNRANGLGFLRWKEAGNLYNEEYTDFEYKNTIKDKDCVVFFNSSYKLAVSCNELYNSVCVYHKLSFSDNLCGNCTLFNYNNNITCFCFATEIDSNYQKAEFLKPYQNQAYFTKYSGINCTIGLEKSKKGDYVWSNTKNDIDYTFWSSDVVFDDTHVYGAISSAGWFLTEEPLDCYFQQKILNHENPNLDLMWVPDQQKFLLLVHNSNAVKVVDNSSLIYCFTDATPWDLIYRYTNLDGGTQINTYNSYYQFAPQTSGPGSYWCSVANSFNNEIVETEHFFFNGTTLEFVSILSVHYIQGNNPLANEILIVLKEALSWKLSSPMFTEKYTLRIMQLVDVDESNRILLVNVHFSATVKQLDHDSEFFQLKSNLQEALNNTSDIEIEMMDFLSSDYCLAEQNSLTWPRTKLGNTVVSQEYCFRPNGDRLNRTCGGNFYVGAKWSFVEACSIANASFETAELEGFLNKNYVDLNKVFSIIQQYEKLNALDIYLIGLLLYKQNVLLTNEKSFLNGLDNILKINTTILEESQSKMRATDMLLFLTENITHSEPSVYNMTNFFLETTNKSIGLSCFNINNTIYTYTNYSMNAAKKQKNFEIGFWLSSDLQNQAENNFPAMLMFYNNSFFSEGLSSSFSRKVIGFLWNSDDAFKGSIYAVERIKNEDIQKDCLIWTYSLQMRGYWRRTSPAQRISPFWICIFQQPGYFSISSSNVTGNLEKVLNDDCDVNVTLQSLIRISERYDEFNVFDIHLVGQIFNKVSVQQDLDLNAIAKTVNHMHEIDRRVLLESQEERASTDVILHQIDNILQNQKNKSYIEIRTTNFAVFIVSLNITDFMGLGVTEDNEYKLFFGEVNITEIITIEHLNSAFVISPDLKKQLNTVKNAKIILTVYHNDALFNEKSPRGTFVGKVFGVILPDIGNYTGPLKIIQKISSENIQPCAYWYYNDSGNIKGRWKKDNNSNSISDFVICEYWHTTHFALLLLDENELDPNVDILDRITSINLALSVFGLGMIILTAIIFSSWRRSSGNQILLNFTISIFLQIITFYVSSIVNQNSQDYILCTVIGVILHYSIISSFAWMLIIAILQFKRFVEVFVTPPKRILLKCFLGGWIAPLIPAIYVLLFDGDNYVSGNIGLCYPSGLGLYIGVWFPLATIILVNLILFIYIILTVVRKKTELVSNIGKNETVLQWRLGVLLFFMLGLTWIFGFMAQLGFGEVFVYLFCFLAPLQGFVVFLFFIVFNTNTRHMYYKTIKNNFSKFF